MSNNLTDKLGNFLVSPAQSRGARGMLGWSQEQLAEAAKISRATIADEYGRRDLLAFGARSDDPLEPPRVVGVPTMASA